MLASYKYFIIGTTKLISNVQEFSIITFVKHAIPNNSILNKCTINVHNKSTDLELNCNYIVFVSILLKIDYFISLHCS